MKHLNWKYVALLLSMFLAVSMAYSQTVPLSTTNEKAKKTFLAAMRNRLRISHQDFLAEMEKSIKADKRFYEPYIVLADQQKNYPEEQEKILLRAIKNQVYQIEEVIEKLAELYRSQGRYDEAKLLIEKLPNDKNRQKQITHYEELIGMKRNPLPFSPKPLIYANTHRDEYFPSVTADDEILSVTLSDFDDFSSDEDLYYSRKVSGEWSPFLPIEELNNRAFNEGSQTISSDGRYMFFVACNMPEGLGSCDIYYSINSNGRWSLPINAGEPLNTEYWESNPSLSVSGDELFFTSSRQPSFGGKDLWSCKVEISDNGRLKFSSPKNMGRVINSDADDYAPFIHSDNKTLYFLSTGHTNFGGSDIFISRKDNGKWQKPTNLGYPINNEESCYGFTLTADGKKAYISLKNHQYEQYGLDIFEFEMPQNMRPDKTAYVKGFIFDEETSMPLEAKIETFDYRANSTLSETLSDRKTGAFTTFMPDTGLYGLNVRKSDYMFYSSRITNTDSVMNIYLKPIKKGKAVVLNNIFFATNSYELSPLSNSEIDKMATFMQTNSEVKVQIVGHTDNVGGEKSNQILSENRAKSVMQALIERGVSPERLSAKGMGLSQPIAPNDTEEGREKNRRVEFVVI